MMRLEKLIGIGLITTAITVEIVNFGYIFIPNYHKWGKPIRQFTVEGPGTYGEENLIHKSYWDSKRSRLALESKLEKGDLLSRDIIFLKGGLFNKIPQFWGFHYEKNNSYPTPLFGKQYTSNCLTEMENPENYKLKKSENYQIVDIK